MQDALSVHYEEKCFLLISFSHGEGFSRANHLSPYEPRLYLEEKTGQLLWKPTSLLYIFHAQTYCQNTSDRNLLLAGTPRLVISSFDSGHKETATVYMTGLQPSGIG